MAGAKSAEYLKKWVLDRKLTTRIEELTPSPWFQQKLGEWQRVMAEWHAKQNVHRPLQFKKAADKEARKRARAKAALDKKAAEEKKKVAEEAKAKADEEKKQGEEEKENEDKKED